MRLLLIVTSTTHYASGLETGLWLSEITHLYHAARAQGHEIVIASTKGGNVPIDPESLKPLVLDTISKNLWEDRSFKEALIHSKSVTEIATQDFDLVYLAGGHGTMYDFPNDTAIQTIVQKQYEEGKIVAAICHGVGGLLNVRMPDGSYVLSGKTVTGFTWFEEHIAHRRKEVPFNLEQSLKERGALYKKALIPMTSHVVVANNLITGENPFSSKEMAQVVLERLGT